MMRHSSKTACRAKDVYRAANWNRRGAAGLVLALALLGAGPLQAQPPAEASLSAVPARSAALTLTEAFRLALAGHPLIRQRQGGIGAAQDEVTAAEWRRFPTLTVDSAHSFDRPPPAVGSTDANALTVRVQQPLWMGGRISSEINAAEIRRGVAQLSLEETELDLLLRVVQSYSDTLRLQERIAVATENTLEHQRLFDLIQRRLDQRVTSEADVSLAKARLQQAKTELVTLQAARANARSTLEQLIGRPLNGDALARPAARTLAWPDARAAVDAARQALPTMRRLDTEVELARADYETKKSTLMPQLALRYEKFAGSAAVIPYDRWQVVLQYQPDAGLSALPGMDAAAKRVAMAQSAVEAGERDLADKVTSQFNEATAFLEQSDASNQYADAAAAVMASYLRQYTAGRKSWLEVLNAQRELALARYNAIDTAAGVVLATHRMDILTGGIAPTTLQATPPAAAAAN